MASGQSSVVNPRDQGLEPERFHNGGEIRAGILEDLSSIRLDCQRLVLSCSSIVLSLFSIVVSLSSISLSILPSSSSRGPMYCPGRSGEGSGSMGLGRRGSGRLGRSNPLPDDLAGFSVFRVFIEQEHTF